MKLETREVPAWGRFVWIEGSWWVTERTQYCERPLWYASRPATAEELGKEIKDYLAYWSPNTTGNVVMSVLVNIESEETR